MYVSKRFLIIWIIDQINLLQSQTELVRVTPNINGKLYIGTFILDIDDALFIGMTLGFIVPKLENIRFWLKMQNKVCCQYYYSLSFLIKKYFVMFIAKIIAHI